MIADVKRLASLIPSPWFLLLAAGVTLFALWGADRVPFHPDESTGLFMSSDFGFFWSKPLALAWRPPEEVDLKTHYRLLDAPLSRQIIGLARALRGLPAPMQDWRWDQSWEWNRQAGALPDPTLLQTARWANTLLLPFSLLFIYLSGRLMGGVAVGLAAALLLGLNALVLLHTRRAMMEAALLLGVCFALWSMVSGQRAWMIGLALGLALCAKQTAAVLVPVGLLAAAWESGDASASRQDVGQAAGDGPRHPAGRNIRRIIVRETQVLGMMAVVVTALNPVYWRAPLPALQEALARRQSLAIRQAFDVARLAPEKSLGGYGERTAALLINLFMAPPAFAEYGNYTQETSAAERAYGAIPGHGLLRGLAGGGFMLAALLFGMALSTLNYRQAGQMGRRALALGWVTTAALTVGHVLLIPLDWQRYVLPLTPLVCLWSAYPLTLLETVKKPLN